LLSFIGILGLDEIEQCGPFAGRSGHILTFNI